MLRATTINALSGSGRCSVSASLAHRRRHPGVALFQRGQDDGHCLGMHRPDLGIRLRGQEAEQVGSHLALSFRTLVHPGTQIPAKHASGRLSPSPNHTGERRPSGNTSCSLKLGVWSAYDGAGLS